MYLFPPKYIALYAKVFLEPLICLIISVLNTFSCLFFHCFFIVMLENPAPFSLSFSSPMTYSSKERSSHIAPFPQPNPQTKRIPLKTSVHFPITITVCKHWSKFVTCSPSSRDCGGVSHP